LPTAFGAGLLLGLSLAYAAADLAAARSAYERGEFATALAQFRTLAEQGSAEAAFQLGLMNANGEGVTQNHAEAVRWYRKAAGKGNADAQRSLGMCFATGQGVEKDVLQAAVWLNLASSQQDPLAQRLRQKLDVELTPTQASQAAQIARQLSGQETVTATATATSGTAACEGVDSMQPLEIGGSVSAPRLLRRVEPAYPPQLRASRFSARVVLRAVVDASGDVRDVGVVSSQNASFSNAAMAAVKKWKFDPARREGCTVPVALTVNVEFKAS
jgi:TonB family protein